MQNMGINQLAQMYMGNPQPLAAKVQQAQQQAKPGQIPPDLKEALALQQIQEMRNAAGNQQAMQASGPQPTVVEQLRQAVAPQQQGLPQGVQVRPQQGVPQGISQSPQPQAPSGDISQLPTNLGQNYAGGGIIAFDDGGDVEKKRQYTLAEQGADWEARLQAARDAEAEGRSPESIKDSEGIMKALKFVGGLPVEALKTLVSAPGYGLSKQESTRAPVSQAAAPVAMPSFDQGTGSGWDGAAKPVANQGIATNRQNAPRPAPQAPAGPLAAYGDVASYFTPQAQSSEAEQLRLQRMRQDPEALAAAKQARYESEVGAPSTAAEKALMDELQAKRARAQAQANPLLEWGRGVAGARPGQKWWQSGLAGSEYADKIAAQRESADTAFLKEILGQQAKIGEIERGYKLGKFNLGDAERQRIYTETLEAAKAQGVSEDAAKKMAQDAVLRREEIASQERQTAQREAGANARHTVPVENQVFQSFLAANKGDPAKAYEAMKAASGGGRGQLTYDQASDNADKWMQSQAGLEYMSRLKKDSKEAGQPMPSVLDIRNELIKNAMTSSGSTYAGKMAPTGNATTGKMVAPPTGFKLD